MLSIKAIINRKNMKKKKLMTQTGKIFFTYDKNHTMQLKEAHVHLSAERDGIRNHETRPASGEVDIKVFDTDVLPEDSVDSTDEQAWITRNPPIQSKMPDDVSSNRMIDKGKNPVQWEMNEDNSDAEDDGDDRNMRPIPPIAEAKNEYAAPFYQSARLDKDSSKRSATTLFSLSDELLTNIARYIPRNQATPVMQTCRRLHSIFHDYYHTTRGYCETLGLRLNHPASFIIPSENHTLCSRQLQAVHLFAKALRSGIQFVEGTCRPTDVYYAARDVFFATQHATLSQFFLGVMYQRAWCVPYQPERALDYLFQAYQNGFPQAAKAISELLLDIREQSTPIVIEDAVRETAVDAAAVDEGPSDDRSDDNGSMTGESASTNALSNQTASQVRFEFTLNKRICTRQHFLLPNGEQQPLNDRQDCMFILLSWLQKAGELGDLLSHLRYAFALFKSVEDHQSDPNVAYLALDDIIDDKDINPLTLYRMLAYHGDLYFEGNHLNSLNTYYQQKQEKLKNPDELENNAHFDKSSLINLAIISQNGKLIQPLLQQETLPLIVRAILYLLIQAYDPALDTFCQARDSNEQDYLEIYYIYGFSYLFFQNLGIAMSIMDRVTAAIDLAQQQDCPEAVNFFAKLGDRQYGHESIRQQEYQMNQQAIRLGQHDMIPRQARKLENRPKHFISLIMPDAVNQCRSYLPAIMWQYIAVIRTHSQEAQDTLLAHFNKGNLFAHFALTCIEIHHSDYQYTATLNPYFESNLFIYHEEQFHEFLNELQAFGFIQAEEVCCIKEVYQQFELETLKKDRWYGTGIYGY